MKGNKGKRREGRIAGILLSCVSFLLPTALRAQSTLFQGERASLELGGYVRSLTALFDLGYDAPETDRTAGFNAEVVRLKWTLRYGENLILEVHNRIQAQLSSDSGSGGSVAGFGVSVVPDRSLDLSTILLEEERVRAWHDIDRLALTVYSGAGDVTLGRQAITWGISNLFPVSDLWAQYSPFELDTEEKPGIDAVRWLSYPGEGLELDIVVADRGSVEDLSAGVRASLSLPWADLYGGGGKIWDELMALVGISAPVGSWKLRAEGVLPYSLDEDGLDALRITGGIDWMGGEVFVSGEYHFNGIGVAHTEDYGAALEDPRFARGETYYLGRHYLGGLVSWTPGNDRLSMALSTLANLQDPSATLTPVVSCDFGQSTRASAGAMVALGSSPAFEPIPTLRSEFGTYGNLLFARISIYF